MCLCWCICVFSSPLFHNSSLNKWCIPFLSTDRSIVYQSEYYKWQHKKQRPVSHISTVMGMMIVESINSWLKTWLWAHVLVMIAHSTENLHIRGYYINALYKWTFYLITDFYIFNHLIHAVSNHLTQLGLHWTTASFKQLSPVVWFCSLSLCCRSTAALHNFSSEL